MQVIKTDLPGVLIIEPKVFEDPRGFFLECYNEATFRANGIDCRFVQDNRSRSKKGVLRGLHFQLSKPQSKLVWAVAGEVYDVAVDVRKGSPTFGKSVGVHLSADNKRQVFVPAGFAHGFCALTDEVEVYYKCSDLYDAKSEGGVIWNDPDLAIAWPIKDPLVSAKDVALPLLSKAVLPTFEG